jgi:hypothetical protein
MDSKDMGYEDVDLVHFAQNTDQWHRSFFFNTVMNLQVL